jgi:hypothetical protein
MLKGFERPAMGCRGGYLAGKLLAGKLCGASRATDRIYYDLDDLDDSDDETHT